MLSSACADVDPDVFFGVGDSPVDHPPYLWEVRALTICAGCPLQASCLVEALRYPAYDQHGVVGGMTAAQRRELLQTGRREAAA